MCIKVFVPVSYLGLHSVLHSLLHELLVPLLPLLELLLFGLRHLCVQVNFPQLLQKILWIPSGYQYRPLTKIANSLFFWKYSDKPLRKKSQRKRALFQVNLLKIKTLLSKSHLIPVVTIKKLFFSSFSHNRYRYRYRYQKDNFYAL